MVSSILMFQPLYTYLAICGPKYVVLQIKNIFNLNVLLCVFVGIFVINSDKGSLSKPSECASDKNVIHCMMCCSLLFLFSLFVMEFIACIYKHNYTYLDNVLTTPKVVLTIILGVTVICTLHAFAYATEIEHYIAFKIISVLLFMSIMICWQCYAFISDIGGILMTHKMDIT